MKRHKETVPERATFMPRSPSFSFTFTVPYFSGSNTAFTRFIHQVHSWSPSVEDRSGAALSVGGIQDQAAAGNWNTRPVLGNRSMGPRVAKPYPQWTRILTWL